MKIVIFGAGVQGTLYGVRLARAGHDVTLIARGVRANELRTQGAVIQHAITGRRDAAQLPVAEMLRSDMHADLCLITVRREQLAAVLPDLIAATRITRFVFMVNHANGSEFLCGALGRTRVVLAFPGAAGGIEDGIDYYVEVAEQATAVEASAPDVAATLRPAGFKVSLVPDMDAWLRRHAVFVTAIAGALYTTDGDASACLPNSRRSDFHPRCTRGMGSARQTQGGSGTSGATRHISLGSAPIRRDVLAPVARLNSWRILFRAPHASRRQRNGSTGR